MFRPMMANSEPCTRLIFLFMEGFLRSRSPALPANRLMSTKINRYMTKNKNPYTSIYTEEQQVTRLAGKQADEHKNHQLYDQEQKPVHEHLYRDAAGFIIDELREKCQEE